MHNITQIPTNAHTHTLTYTDEIRSQYCCRQPYFPFSSPSSTKLFERIEVRGAFIFICYSFSPSHSFVLNSTIRSLLFNYPNSRVPMCHSVQFHTIHTKIKGAQTPTERTNSRSPSVAFCRNLFEGAVERMERERASVKSAHETKRGMRASEINFLSVSILNLANHYTAAFESLPLFSLTLLWHVCVLSVIKHAHIIIVSHIALSHMVSTETQCVINSSNDITYNDITYNDNNNNNNFPFDSVLWLLLLLFDDTGTKSFC